MLLTRPILEPAILIAHDLSGFSRERVNMNRNIPYRSRGKGRKLRGSAGEMWKLIANVVLKIDTFLRILMAG